MSDLASTPSGNTRDTVTTDTTNDKSNPSSEASNTNTAATPSTTSRKTGTWSTVRGRQGEKGFYERAQSCRYISELARRLRLPAQSTALACVYLHKFYDAFPRHGEHFSISTACVYLASKTSETPRRVRDVLNVAHAVQNPHLAPLVVDKHFWEMRDSLTEQEQVVLRGLEFRIDHELPHATLFNYLRSLDATPSFAQVAFTVLSDCFLIGECATRPPHVLAGACIYFASRISKSPLPTCFARVFQVTEEEYESISRQLIKLYQAPLPGHRLAPCKTVECVPESVRKRKLSVPVSRDTNASSATTATNPTTTTTTTDDDVAGASATTADATTNGSRE